ncbi:phenylacetic acid degradation protein [Microlunatus endophyticus]|uniref:Phenylacetic acid degradation protein n=1 Tax=Microlunatus endophyticus TaxID=1716077 RepID=A0A917W296_9ACTN|nr:PaaI family thioesterase [Microlunatus endophyticus]GGL54240.1 phenylacetic acid degradation protein [Microlunatus endophyticus]
MSERIGSERLTDKEKPAWSEILDLGPRPARPRAGERQRTYEWSDPAEVARVAPETSGLDFLQKMINGEVAPSALSRTLDFDLVEANAGRVVVTARPAEFQCNAIGTVHGGVIASWADTAMGYAIQSRLPVGISLTTLDLQVRYLRAVRPDDAPVSIIGTTDHVGRRTGVARAEVHDADQRLVATATTSCLILPRGQ